MTANWKMEPKLCLFLIFASIIITTDFSSALPDSIRIAGLFESDEDPKVESAFKFAIDRVNSNRFSLGKSKLVSAIEQLTSDDSFHTSKKLCQSLKGGLAAVFGPRSMSSAAHVQSIADTLGVPHIEYRWDFRTVRPEFSLNLYPHPANLSKAYLDLIRDWKWRSFTLVYEDNQGLVRLQELLKAELNDVKMYVRRLEANSDHRPLLKEMKKSGESRIVLDCSAERLPSILSSAMELGMMTPYHSYLVTSLDLHTVNLDEFRQTQTNITAFRIIQPERIADLTSMLGRYIFHPNFYSQPVVKEQDIKTEVALVYDAVLMFTRALNDVDKRNMRYGFDIPAMYCNASMISPWSKGNETIQRMKKLTHEGVTGLISFDAEGFRTNFTLDIISYHSGELKKSGTWNADGVNITRTNQDVEKDIKKAFENHHFKVIVKLPSIQRLE